MSRRQVPTKPPPDPLDEALARFEAAADPKDPQQAELLAAMREHTLRLHQARGDWCQPSTDRCWNSTKPPAKARKPLEVESYRYLAYDRAFGFTSMAAGLPTTSIALSVVPCMYLMLLSPVHRAYKQHLSASAPPALLMKRGDVEKQLDDDNVLS